MLKENDISECILESVKAHIAGVASLDTFLAGSDGQKAAEFSKKGFTIGVGCGIMGYTLF